MTDSEQGYTDSEGDPWIRVSPGRYAIAMSESHAQRLLDSGSEGTRLETIEETWGPLKPLHVY